MSRPGPLVVGQTVIDIGVHRDIISEPRVSGDNGGGKSRPDAVDTQLTHLL